MSKDNTKYWQDGERRDAEQQKTEITCIESKYLFSGCCVFFRFCIFPLFSHSESVYLCYFFFQTYLRLCFSRCVSRSLSVMCPPSMGKLARSRARASFLQIQKSDKWLGFFQVFFKNQEVRVHLGLRWDNWEKGDY